MQLKTGVKIVLGQNFRGLVAAHEIGKVRIVLIFPNNPLIQVFPLVKENILVFSSIYAASVKVKNYLF